MKIWKLLLALLLCIALCPNAFAQETCSEEDLAAIGTCKAACDAQYPSCAEEDDSIVDQLDDHCKTCADYKNVGQYVKCMKQFRNGARKTGQATDDLKDAIKTRKTDCKLEKKEDKKGKDKGDDDDSSDAGDDTTTPTS